MRRVGGKKGKGKKIIVRAGARWRSKDGEQKRERERLRIAMMRRMLVQVIVGEPVDNDLVTRTPHTILVSDEEV